MRVNNTIAGIAAAAVVIAALGSGPAADAGPVDYVMVSVGDPGNAPDASGYGAVAEAFRIGKHEVTAGQYAAFLNAVAKSDPHSLWSPSMASDPNVAGIARAGESGAYSYRVIDNNGSSANRPIAHVSWFDAARFANWMHNGQGEGGTETGAYTLVDGQTSGIAPAKNPGARFFLPTEDQWYKAAYYKGGGRDAGYWIYATQSDEKPGNRVGGEPNQANYAPGGVFSVTQAIEEPSRNHLSDVGAFTNSRGPYGTFDQSGNVSEWNDLDGAAAPSRGRRGDRWVTPDPYGLSRGFREAADASYADGGIGFRLAGPALESATAIDGIDGGSGVGSPGAGSHRIGSDSVEPQRSGAGLPQGGVGPHRPGPDFPDGDWDAPRRPTTHSTGTPSTANDARRAPDGGRPRGRWLYRFRRR